MKKILLVHDAELFLRVEQTILRRRDYQIYKARTGSDALTLAREKRPNLIILDDGLRDPSALEVCHAIRTHPLTVHCSILLSLSKHNREALDEYLKAGANDYVVKPVNRLLFNQRVTNLLHVPARRFLRTLLKAQVEGEQEGGCSFFGSTINVSESGALIETRRPLEKGERIILQFFLPGDPDPLYLEGEVVRTKEDMPQVGEGYGLSFTRITEEDRQRIRSFVQRRVEGEGYVSDEIIAPRPEAIPG